MMEAGEGQDVMPVPEEGGPARGGVGARAASHGAMAEGSVAGQEEVGVHASDAPAAGAEPIAPAAAAVAGAASGVDSAAMSGDPVADGSPDVGAAAGGVKLGDGDASLLGLVDRLAAILERSDLLELEVRAGATGLILRRPEALGLAMAGVPGSGAVTSAGSAARAERSDAPTEPARASVRAPLTGIWYSAPTPGSAPFVHVGGEVNVGQVIGLIEAMKLFNEIKSDLAGRVVRVGVENGQLVKAKQPLIEVEPL